MVKSYLNSSASASVGGGAGGVSNKTRVRIIKWTTVNNNAEIFYPK